MLKTCKRHNSVSWFVVYKSVMNKEKISTDNRYFMSKINDWHVIILYLKFLFVLILFQFQFQFYNFCEKKPLKLIYYKQN